MTIRPTDDRITSDVTPHTAIRTMATAADVIPGGATMWSVSWLPRRRLDRNQAISAMLIADILGPAATMPISAPIDDMIRAFAAELELGMTLNEVKRLAGTLPGAAEPAPVHDTHAIPPGDEPAKTHDLSVRKLHGGTIIAADSEAEGYDAYLPPGVAQDLGRVLAVLTPAQVRLLIGELTGGEK